jgi:2-methylcitrate dehydratase PrpD
MVLSPALPEADAGDRAASAAGLTALCNWAVAVRGKALPDSVRRRAAMVLADDLSAIVVAAGEPQIAQARALLLACGGAPEATVLAEGAFRATREQAAAANGLAVCWAELDEGYRPLPCHAGAYVLPALLAEAEATDRTMDEVLGALAVGYEITARVARAYPFHRLSVHPHAAFNAIGAAAGLSALRGHDAETMFAAITAASTMVNPGPFNHAIEGALVRNVWTSIGATAGFRAADFAPLGIAGLRGALHDVFVDCFGCRPRSEELSCDLPSGRGAWAIESGYHKLHACCQYTHSAVEASLSLAERVSDHARIVGIEVETHARGLALDVRAPETVLAAKFSMPHAVAAVAVRADAGPRSFDTASLADPAIAQLRKTVRLVPHDDVRAAPNDRPARVHWILDDGSRLTAAVDSARGGADQPFSEAELMDKFARLTRDTFPAAGEVLAGMVAGRDIGAPWRDVLTRIVA